MPRTKVTAAPLAEQFLEQQVRELVAVNEALLHKMIEQTDRHDQELSECGTRIDALVVERDEARKGALEAEENAGFWRRTNERSSASAQDAIARAKEYEKQRDNLRAIVTEKDEAVDRISRKLDEARVHADLMRRQAYPAAPDFPWEERAVRDGMPIF